MTERVLPGQMGERNKRGKCLDLGGGGGGGDFKTVLCYTVPNVKMQ